MTPAAQNCAPARTAPRSNSSNTCSGAPTISCAPATISPRARGMDVGLYLDVAVGVQSDGFDAWNEQVAISRHLSVGAPPDQLNSAGQNWGLAGFNAAGLELTGFAPFRDMLRASMRYAGAIRLDHVLGLNRLYLVPHGFAADNGVYVKMPLEALLAVTAQESVANRCVVIGEDLGTVPEGFRERLAAWGDLVVSGDDVRTRLSSGLVLRRRSLSARGAGDLQHPRSRDLFGMAQLRRSAAQARRSASIPAKATTRGDTRWRCSATCCGSRASSRRTSMRSLTFLARTPIAAARDFAGRSARRDRAAQRPRHRVRTSELATSAAACARRDRIGDQSARRCVAATAERRPRGERRCRVRSKTTR